MDWWVRRKGVNDTGVSLKVGITIPQDREQVTSSFADDEFSPELVEFESRYKTQPTTCRYQAGRICGFKIQIEKRAGKEC